MPDNPLPLVPCPLPLSFYLFTTGCKANQWDSHLIAEGLKQAGLLQAPFAKAHLLIINGCTLTKGAERDIRRFVQRCRAERPGAKVILVGCHAQVYGENTFGADLVLGHQEKFRIATLLEQTGTIVAKGRDFPLEEWGPKGIGSGRTRFFFKIQDGCDHFCSYCIVPFARGKGRSRPATAILEGMAFLKEKGIQEVVLTGIDIASYKDASSGLDFAGLLARLENADTPPRIRISSVDPMVLNNELLDIIAASTKVAPSLHIPLQSGCDRILKEMRRPYSCSHIRDVVDRLRQRIPDVGLGMDVMLGFPGETEQDFDDTFKFIESLNIYYLHVFPYSDRQGTRASAMEPKVPESVKKARVREMKGLDLVKRVEFYQRFVGHRLSIIPEGKQTRDGLMKGYSENYIPIYMPYEKTLENKIVEVTIRGLKNNLPIGER
jgi:threonylcarbamoyladenosine tRNA methylthiotransferase MtaB